MRRSRIATTLKDIPQDCEHSCRISRIGQSVRSISGHISIWLIEAWISHMDRKRTSNIHNLCHIVMNTIQAAKGISNYNELLQAKQRCKTHEAYSPPMPQNLHPAPPCKINGRYTNKLTPMSSVFSTCTASLAT